LSHLNNLDAALKSGIRLLHHQVGIRASLFAGAALCELTLDDLDNRIRLLQVEAEAKASQCDRGDAHDLRSWDLGVRVNFGRVYIEAEAKTSLGLGFRVNVVGSVRRGVNSWFRV